MFLQAARTANRRVWEQSLQMVSIRGLHGGTHELS
jgi:hypothetical protein